MSEEFLDALSMKGRVGEAKILMPPLGVPLWCFETTAVARCCLLLMPGYFSSPKVKVSNNKCNIVITLLHRWPKVPLVFRPFFENIDS